MRTVLSTTAIIVGLVIVLGVVIIGGQLAVSEARYQLRMTTTPDIEKEAVTNGLEVAERFRTWIAENRAYPQGDSLRQAILNQYAEAPNVLQNNRPIRFSHWANQTEPGDLVLIGYGYDPAKDPGPPFAFQCTTDHLVAAYAIYKNRPEKVEWHQYLR